MRFTIVAVGRVRAAGIAGAVAEYERRAARYWPLRVVEVKEGGGGSRSPDDVRRREGESLLECAGDALLICCDERGSRMSSTEFAAVMQRWREDGRHVAFLIGGSHGLAPAVIQRASSRIALAPWTLPHEMARLVLAEQLYRAGTIIRGEPYHK